MQKGCIELFQAKVLDNLGAKEGTSSQKFGFIVLSSAGQNCLLACENDYDKQEWIEYLQAVISELDAPVAIEIASTSVSQGWLLKKGGSNTQSKSSLVCAQFLLFHCVNTCFRYNR